MPSMSPSTTSPLRDSPRNATSTIPLRINKQDSPLTSTAIPNPSYHRLPTQLARRQSSSYNHVKNNALVSNSPFVKRLARPSRIPTPTRGNPTAIDEDENRTLDTESSKRRQSRGLHVLAKEQVVSKSPFLGERKRSNSDNMPRDNPRPLSCPEPLPVSIPDPGPEPEPEPLPAVAPGDAPSTSVPVTPRNPRVTDLAGPHMKSPSPSPKSSLASPKRLRGPRSQSSSPTRQRRKTVTFDERCDVLEFDRDEMEMDEEAVASDDEDYYGPPEPPLKDAVHQRSQDGSFNSDLQMEYYDEHTPVFQGHVPGYDDKEYDDVSPAEKLEDSYEEQSLQAPESSFEHHHQRLSLSLDRSNASFDEPMVSPRLDLRLEQNVSLDFTDTSSNPGENIGMDDLTNALDRFMLGVQSEGALDADADRSIVSMQVESIAEGDISMRSEQSYRSAQESVRGQESTEISASFDAGRQGTSSDGEDTEEPITPTGGQEQSFAEDEDVFDNSIEHGHQASREESKDESITEHAPPEQDQGEEPLDEAEPSFLSQASTHTADASHNTSFQPPITTSTPPVSPRKEPHTPSHPHVQHYDHSGPLPPTLPTLTKSLSLPPLSFSDNAIDNNILPDSWDVPLSQLAASLSEPNMGSGSGSFISSFAAATSNTTPPTSLATTPSSNTFRSQLPQPVRDNTFLVRTTSTSSNASSIPPPVPPKDDLPPGMSARQLREEMIKAKRREIKEAEEELDLERRKSGVTKVVSYVNNGEGRPSRRRSLSTGDAEDLGSNTPAAQRRLRGRDLLDIPIEMEEEDRPLGMLIDQELKVRRKPTVKEKERMYKLRERENTIYASSDDKVSHMGRAGDVDSGKAWRTVRRPSDMNEYSRQIREYRQQKGAKAHGKVFVRVVGLRGLNAPIPREPTMFTCTLNNGIHSVVTPECRLMKDARIEQEFELIEHSKLEFTLTLKVRRDAHIIAQTKANTAPPPPPPQIPVPVARAPAPSSHRGMRSFFHVGSSPKKSKVAANVTVKAPIPPALAPPPIQDNLARYLRADGTLGRAFVSFKEVSKRCDSRLFETSFPLIGQRQEVSGPNAPVKPWTMGEIVLQMFKLPPLPGVKAEELPQSLEECHRGLRHLAWHKVTYHEGVLTQNGGDCRTWRRRLLRVVGANLIAFNDVTKKVTATVDLKKAVAVEDDDPTSPALPGMPHRIRDEFDDMYRVERSFRLVFQDGEEIQYFADTDEEKGRWLEILRALVGHIPPNPLWAELVWQRQEEKAREKEKETQGQRATSPTPTTSSMQPGSQSSRPTLATMASNLSVPTTTTSSSGASR